MVKVMRNPTVAGGILKLYPVSLKDLVLFGISSSRGRTGL